MSELIIISGFVTPAAESGVRYNVGTNELIPSLYNIMTFDEKPVNTKKVGVMGGKTVKIFASIEEAYKFYLIAN